MIALAYRAAMGPLLCLPFAMASSSLDVAPRAPRGARVPISIAQPAPVDAFRDGPLFIQVKSAASTKDEGGFRKILSPMVKMVFVGGASAEVGSDKVNAVLIKIAQECKGPFTIDEGKYPDGKQEDWVQTSWVCHIGTGSDLSDYFKFRFSPEVDLEFGFVDGKVTSIFAAELVPVPGRRLLKMDAADTMDGPH